MLETIQYTLRACRDTMAHVLCKYDVHVAHVSTCKLSLVNVKDKLQKECFPGVVYEVLSANCECVYICVSSNIKRQLKEHSNDVKNKRVSSNALAEHAQASSHEINGGKARVVATKNLTSRLYVESLTIPTRKSTLNSTNGNLPPAYARCLGHVL